MNQEQLRDSAAIRDVINERQRQIEKEGWTEDHDKNHGVGELSQAGACYAIWAFKKPDYLPQLWPWDAEWWKHKDARKNLVRAAALIIAEIESCDRNHSWPPATKETPNAQG